MNLPNDALSLSAGLALGFAAWCVRVELRLNKERQLLQALEGDLQRLQRDLQRSSEDLHHHGEMLAAIKATVEMMASALRDLSLRLERLGERTL